MIFLNFDINAYEIILFSALLFFLLFYLFFYWGVLARPYFYIKKLRAGTIDFSKKMPPVSVIIYTKNDRENLQLLLPAIMGQDYPEYEVIVVNDDPANRCEDLLKRYESEYNNFYHTYVPEGNKNLNRKKLGLSIGIKAAKHNTLLFTETDANPVGDQWLRNMVRNFTYRKSVVLGFSVWSNPSKDFMCRFAAYDYFYSNVQMMAMALMRHSYGANGKNLSFLKEDFNHNRGYSRFRAAEVGADDLLVDEIANKDNLAVDLSPESLVRVKWDSLSEWIFHKIGRAQTNPYYRRFPVALWRTESTLRLLFALLLLTCVLSCIYNILLLPAAILVLLVKVFTQKYILGKIAAALKIRKPSMEIFTFDCIQPFVNLYFYIYRLFQMKKIYV